MTAINHETLADLVAEKLADKLNDTLSAREFEGERHLTIPELEKLWGCGRSKVYDLIKEHKLPVLKIDSKTRVALKHAQRIVEECTVTPS